MPFPRPVPSLSHDEYQQFLQELEDFELSEDVHEDIQNHIEMLDDE